MSHWAQDQATFMRAGEQAVGSPDPDQAARYLGHILEEACETERAFDDEDYVKAVDGAVDTIVVAIGFLHSLGVDPDAAWDAVHAANMRKVIDGRVYRRPDGQIGKPPGWYGPEAELRELCEAAGVPV